MVALDIVKARAHLLEFAPFRIFLVELTSVVGEEKEGEDGEGVLDRLRGWIDVQRHIDEQMYRLAEQVVATEAGALFETVDPRVIEGSTTPDAIDHSSVLLGPNPFSGTEQDEVLGLLDLLP